MYAIGWRGTRRLEQLTLPDGEVRYRIGNRWFRREELEHTYSFERLPASYREFVDMFGVQPPTGRRGVLSIYTRPATGQYVGVRLTTHFDLGFGMNHSDVTPDAAFTDMLALAQMDGLTIEIDPSVDAFLAVATAYTWGENERGDRVIVRRPH